jgi:lipid-A-disaccharide synthase
LYDKITGNAKVKLIKGKTYEILQISDAALVASGTATLETALLNVPQVVCYRGDFISMVIAWAVIRVRYISLVNLILDGEVVRELIQYSLNKENLKKEMEAILPGGNKKENVLEGYSQLKHKLGKAGASARIAQDMVKTLGKQVKS